MKSFTPDTLKKEAASLFVDVFEQRSHVGRGQIGL